MSESSIESRFGRSIAVVVGIDKYESGIPPLKTAANDARRLANMLAENHDFEVRLFLDEDASHERLLNLLTEQLPQDLDSDDRLIFYFAGHGVALDGDDGPNGYLLPQDARRGEEDSYLFMPLVHDALLALPVRHALIIMDSCFSGAFRWAATRSIVWMPDVVHEERFDRFVKDPAWQVITSTAHDQEAMDQLSSGSLGTRPDQDGHSPFALALFEALEGKGDVVPAEGGDGLITATELYLYLESRLQPETMEEGTRQTPGLWPLSRHDKGEFVFAVPGQELNLPPAPPLDLDNNPYRGLESYDREHAELFFGRDKLVTDLEKRVETEALTVVLGASGTGKSSVVKAGLLPRLERRDGWRVLPTVRPGAHPLMSLSRAVGSRASAAGIKARIMALCEENPRTVLFIDQFEELVTMTQSPDEREAVLRLLRELLEDCPDRLEIIATLRTDFEPQFRRGELQKFWDDGRNVIPPMTQDDLRDCILKPAAARVMYFKPDELVDELINEVVATPGGLPLLSFALSEMYIHYLGRGSDDRAIEREDYEAVGGVVGALRSRANAEYEALDEDHRVTMRLMMLRMVAAGGGNVARRRVLRSELEFDSDRRNEQVKTIVDRLVAARLIVMGSESTDDGPGEDYVEPAHDALVRAWGLLLTWVHAENERDPDDLRFQRKLGNDAEAWVQTDAGKLRKGLLWSDAARSASLKSLIRGGADWLNRREWRFAEKSVQARRRFRQLAAVVMFVVVLSAGVAVQQGVVALNESKRAEARALAAEIRASLAEGNLHRALQVGRRSLEEYPRAPEVMEAMREISMYDSAQLTSLRMPAFADAFVTPDDRWIIAYSGIDQREEVPAREVYAVDWNGTRTLLTSGAATIDLSPDGRWLTTTSFGDFGWGETAVDDKCITSGAATIFEATGLPQIAEPLVQDLDVPDVGYPKIGGGDLGWLAACNTAVISGSLDEIVDRTSWRTSDGFDTGARIGDVFFDELGRIVTVHTDRTRVFARNGDPVFDAAGGDATAGGGRLATTTNRWTAPRVHVYDKEGRQIAEFEGIEPVLSADGRWLAFENSGDEWRTTLVDLDSIQQPGPTIRHDVAGTSPLFSADGGLLATMLTGDRNDSRPATSRVTESQSGRPLFDVEGEATAFARSRPALITIVGVSNIHLWDVRRFSTRWPLVWDGLSPAQDSDAREGLAAFEYTCDDMSDTCSSPDGTTTVEATYPEGDSVSPIAYRITRSSTAPDSDLGEVVADLIADIRCTYHEGTYFFRTRPWVFAACDGGVQVFDLNGDIVQSYDGSGESEGAILAYGESALFELQSGRNVRLHVLSQPGSHSLDLGQQEAFVSAADHHPSGTAAVAAGNGSIRVYDDSGVLTHTMFIGLENAPVRGLRFSPDGNLLFARDQQGAIHRWIVTPDGLFAAYDWVEPLSDEEWAALTQ
ncbi:MAG: caspase family protein [Woeseiaceae bacterium]|nr:caspase family protein [Woeseiaceae bacterium]